MGWGGALERGYMNCLGRQISIYVHPRFSSHTYTSWGNYLDFCLRPQNTIKPTEASWPGGKARGLQLPLWRDWRLLNEAVTVSWNGVLKTRSSDPSFLDIKLMLGIHHGAGEIWEKLPQPGLYPTIPDSLLVTHVIRSHAHGVKLGRVAYNVTDVTAVCVGLNDSKSPRSQYLFGYMG